MMTIQILIYPKLEKLFGVLGSRCEAARQYFAICKDCGANRYTGVPCVKPKDRK